MTGKAWAMLVVGLLVGGLFGGIAGYVVNDLTSKENPEVVEEIRREREVQDDFERMLQDLGSRPPAASRPEAAEPPSPEVPAHEAAPEGEPAEDSPAEN